MPGNADMETIRQAYICMYDGMISKNEKAGYKNIRTKLIDGRVPCAVAVIVKE